MKTLTSRTLLSIAITAMLLTSGTSAFAQIGTGPKLPTSSVGPASLILDDNGDGVTFFGKGGYSADGIGTLDSTGSVTVDVPVGATVEKAILYATTQFDGSPASVTLTLDGTPYVLPQTPFNTYDGCCALESFKYTGADLDAQVQAAIDADDPSSVTTFSLDEGASSGLIDGSYLVVVYSHPSSPEVSILILDGSTASSGEQTLIGLSTPLDKTIPGFTATLALGIGFSFQAGADFAGSHVCGTGQFSTVTINGATLTECAGHMDDGIIESNGALATIGGFGDSTDNPPVPASTDGFDDELYNLEPFLAQGITLIDMDTANSSFDDLIFVSIFSITAKASLEICDNGIDDDGDGLIDEGCEQPPIVAGELLSVDTTALFVSGIIGSMSLMVPIAAAGIAGAGIYLARTKL